MEISASLFQLFGGLVAYGFIALVFIVISVNDLRTRRIPNSCIIALVALRLVICILDSLAGNPFQALSAFGVSLFVSAGIAGCMVLLKVLLERRSGRESLGWGDVKLLAAGCLFLNLEQAFVALFVASVLGCVLGLCFRFVRKDNTFPFGPALCAGLMAGLFV